MPENEINSPDETHTFVDKRRTVDFSQDDESSETDIDNAASSVEPDEETQADEPTTHSIYEIGAYVAGLLINEGFQRLGLIADPQTGKAVQDLPSARVAIDCVAALVNVIDEPASTLQDSMRRELKRTLNDLRLNYLERSRS